MLELLLMLLLLPSFLVIIFCAWFCPVFNNQGIAKEMLFRRQQRWQAARSAYYLPDAPECLRWHPSSLTAKWCLFASSNRIDLFSSLRLCLSSNAPNWTIGAGHTPLRWSTASSAPSTSCRRHRRCDPLGLHVHEAGLVHRRHVQMVVHRLRCHRRNLRSGERHHHPGVGLRHLLGRHVAVACRHHRDLGHGRFLQFVMTRTPKYTKQIQWRTQEHRKL